MHIETEAIIVAVRPHGEHGAVVRVLTPRDGLQAGYVRGGRSRRLRPVLAAGNVVQADFRARTTEQLALLTAELVHSRAHLFQESIAAAGIDWVAALTASALPEGQPYPRIYLGLDGLLSAIEAAPNARSWGAALVSYEMLVLGETGFGQERFSDAPDGDMQAPGWEGIHKGLKRSGFYLERDLLTGRQAGILAARERLIERLKRIG